MFGSVDHAHGTTTQWFNDFIAAADDFALFKCRRPGGLAMTY
jgi:hypothetical protein